MRPRATYVRFGRDCTGASPIMWNVPKILHLYWDRSPMSWFQTLTVKSFRKYNPDWEIRLYLPKQVYTGGSRYIPDYTGPDFFNDVLTFPGVQVIDVDLNDYNISEGHHNILRSDILRYHLLYEYGGVWSDFDVIWLKPVDHFNNITYFGSAKLEEITAVVSFIQGTHGGHSIGIMMHTKGDPYVKSLIELTAQVKPPFGHEVFGGVMLNEHYPTLESLSRFPGVVGACFETYYPYCIHPPNQTIRNLYYGVDLNPVLNSEVLCLHWYNGHVLSKNYVNGEGLNRDCSMTQIIKKEGYA